MDEQKAKPRTNLDGLTVRSLSADEAEAFVQTHEISAGKPFGGVAGLAFFNWQYLGVPEKLLWVKVAVATAGAEPGAEQQEAPFAAVYAMVPRRFVIDGQPAMAACSLNTLTGPAYRGRGLFVQLASQCYESAVEEGLKLVYGFPNENSIHGFTKYLSWRVVKRGEFMISFRPFAWLRGRLRGEDPQMHDVTLSLPGASSERVRIRRIENFDERFDTLWERCSPSLGIAAVRDRAFLQWRFAAHPQVDYGIYIAESTEGELLGYCVTRGGAKGSTRGYIMDMMALPEHSEAGVVMVRHAARALASRGARLLITNMGSQALWSGVLRRAGFFPAPERVAPTQRVSYCAFDSDIGALHERPDDWHITYADIDVL